MKNQSGGETEAESAVTILDADGVVVSANESAVETLGYTKDTLLGSTFDCFLSNPCVKHGRNFEKMKSREFHVPESKCELGDGSEVMVSAHGEPTTYEGKENHVRVEFEVVEELDHGTEVSPGDELSARDFDDISPENLQQIVQSIRVNAPSGEMPLNAIMLDLAVGHNELEQYKQGALSLNKAVDERLEEEEKRNPESEECDVLREVRDAAFGLYLRIHRGDAEITGERDGKYSGYFN